MAERSRPTDFTTSMTRRQFLRRAGKAALAAGVLSQAGLLGGCGGRERRRRQVG